MKQKKQGIKIKKHRYNLYNRKKSTGKKVLGTVLTVLAAAVLCVVGFGIGRPLMEYFQNKNSGTSGDSSPSWTPPVASQTEESSPESDEAPQTSATTGGQPTQDDPVLQEDAGAAFLDAGALANTDSLKSATAAAKSAGFTAVCVTLKDDMGYVLYKTGIESVKDTDAVKGTLTAKQIADTIKGMGMTPVARINTLKDHVGGIYFGGNYLITGDMGAWHNAAPANGGKKWLDPFNAATSAYIGQLAEELAGAGFGRIILANTIFPQFHPTDYSEYLAGMPIADETARLNALWDVITAARTAAEQSGAVVMLETNGDALFADNRLSTTAEAAADKERLLGITLLADYTGDAAYTAAKSFSGRMSALFPGQEYAVHIGGGASNGEILKAFTEDGTAVYSG